MKVTLLTYNLLFNGALPAITEVIEKYNPDIMCFQEIETDKVNLKNIEKSGYRLADYSNSFIKFGKIYGLATFYNEAKLTYLDSSRLNLPRSYYEVILFMLRGGNNPRTVLKTEFRDKETNQKIISYNLHLSHLGTNGIRVRQVKETLNDLKLAGDDAILISGDFNYPYGRRAFEEIIHKYELKEATSAILYTLEKKVLKFITVKLKLDYILYKNLSLIHSAKATNRDSDHFPIIAEFEL